MFNHKQTESLLKNGYVTSRGKAYASGNAYAAGSVHPWLGGMNIDDDWQNISIPIWNAATNGKYLDDAADSVSDAADEFEEVLDWIEIRLEEINEQLDLMSAKLENAVGYAAKNNIIDQMLGVNNTKFNNLQAGAEKYAEYASKLLTKIPAQYQEAAQNGAIAIKEFAGEADEATVEAINNYREWVQKVADLKQQLEEVKTEIQDLAKQKFDNVSDEYDNIISLIENANEKLDTQVSLMEDSGYVASKKYYESMVENTKKQNKELENEKEALQAVLDEQVKLGNIKVGSEAWYEMVNALYEVDLSIMECSSELENFQNAINDIYWDNFDQLINRLDYLKDETQGLIDLMDSDDMVADPQKKKYENGTVEYWTADDVQWTDEGLASLGLYAQQMEIAEYKARQYAEAIDDLTKDFNDGKYSENEYLEKLNELTNAQYDSIEAYYDAQDAIKDLNETRIDSIKNGIEKEIEAYEELIEKQKEELNAEKDLHDFQKSIAEQEKNISDIKRKLAAIENDNSISAAAQRKKLQAELAEAEYELEEMYYDRSVEDKNTALDKELESFQEEKNAEITKWEEYLDNIETVVADSLTLIQANASGIYDTLNQKANEYDLTLSESITTPWKDGALAVSDYQTAFDTAMSSTMDQLEGIKLKWQDIIDKMNEAAATEINNQTKENNRYVTPQQSTTTSNTTSSGTSGYDSYTVQKGDTLWDIAAAKLGDATRWREIYDLNTDVISNPDLIYPGQKLKLPKYAKGTLGTSKDQFAWIDELGEELIIRPQNGRMTFLEKGTGVVPADLTANLMEWGKLDPSIMLEQNRPVISAPQVVNNNMEISMEISEVVHIDTVTQDTIPDLTKAINKQLDKYMTSLNGQLRKYSR